MREKEYSEWMGKQGFDALRHANCCKIAFNGGWESRQTEVDEANAKALMCRDEKNHAINRWGAICKERDELQKRVDAGASLVKKYHCGEIDLFDLVDELEQALKGEAE